jgi:hypothetical protein
MDLRLPVDRLGGRPLAPAPQGAFRGLPGLIQGVTPGAPQLHDLGPMHKTAAGEGDHIRLPRAPLGQRGGPFLSAPRLVRRLAAEDDAAIDESAGYRRKLTRGDGHHRLVEQPQAFHHPALRDQEAALIHAGEGGQVRVAEALADLGRLGCRRDRGIEVTARRVLEDDRHQHITLLHALAPLPLDQPLGAAEPSGRLADLARELEMDGEPARAACGAHDVGGVQVRLMATFQGAAILLLVAQHVGGGGEQLQVLRSQWSGPIGG